MMFFLFLLVSGVSSTSVQMRIVKDTASYGYFGSNNGETENNPPSSNVQPANFSGPHLLQRLIGRCYNLTEVQYQYTFCPFQNFSQHELSSRWNAYHGVLGVWSHWDIKNNTFSSMVYNHGDKCGNVERSVHVHLECGAVEILANVSEPKKCQYSAVFQSRYVCHNDSLLVYPRLPDVLQKKWDHLLSEFNNGDITEKGYYSGLEKLFQMAGFLENTTSESPEKVHTEATAHLGNMFTDLATCNKEYKNIVAEITHLNQEVDALKLLLDLSKIETRTTKPQ